MVVTLTEVRSWISRSGGGLLFTAAEARDASGEVCAQAQGVVRMLEGFGEAKRY